MSSKIINLRTHKKQKARAEKRIKGDEKAALHSIHSAEKQRNAAQKALDEKRLDAMKRERSDD